MARVSVVIPTYNSAQYLPDTLDSVLSQSCSAVEVIVVDDGSTDNTEAAIAPFRNKIKYIRQDNSGGPARPRNVGINAANGEYIVIFDSDDVMLPGKLQGSANFLDAYPTLGMAFTDWVAFDERGPLDAGTHINSFTHFHAMKKTFVGKGRFVIPGQVAFEGLFFENYVGTSGVMIPARVFATVGLFDETVTYGGVEDRDMWFRIARSYDLGFLDIVGHRYRFRHGSVSRRALAAAEARITVLKRYNNARCSAPAKRMAQLAIAANLHVIGYCHREAGNFRAARQCYIRSLATAWNRPAARGLGTTLVGKRMFRLLRQLLSASA